MVPLRSPSGTYADPTKTEASSNAKGCSLCGINTYRSGDAAPENNKCLPIPDGEHRFLVVAQPASGTGNGHRSCIIWM